ncbi:hypothetical protein MNB_SV-13-1121 [hydrothermal vent metagenome]|uniref:Prokaryotic metallothionein n=1 Tax=hydrothermal vent metagenome TaxID=652676 RepID=A0A1W1CKM3_9ZZZZ
MFLKLLILAVVLFLIYRFFGGKLPTFGRSVHQKKLDDDTLIECEKCSTYVTVKESLLSNGHYYCSLECQK